MKAANVCNKKSQRDESLNVETTEVEYVLSLFSPYVLKISLRVFFRFTEGEARTQRLGEFQRPPHAV